MSTLLDPEQLQKALPFFKAVGTFFVGFMAGIIVAFGKGWVQEFYEKRGEKRMALHKDFRKIVDSVARITSNEYNDNPYDSRDGRRFVLVPDQLRACGKQRLAGLIDSYRLKWIECYKEFKAGSESSDEVRLVELRKELGSLKEDIVEACKR